MQEQKFNALMLGESTKWAELNNNEKLVKMLQGNDLTTEEKRKALEDVEVQISKDVEDNVRKFIADCKQKKMKQRTIRRAVQRKFKITVV